MRMKQRKHTKISLSSFLGEFWENRAVAGHTSAGCSTSLATRWRQRLSEMHSYEAQARSFPRRFSYYQLNFGVFGAFV